MTGESTLRDLESLRNLAIGDPLRTKWVSLVSFELGDEAEDEKTNVADLRESKVVSGARRQFERRSSPQRERPG